MRREILLLDKLDFHNIAGSLKICIWLAEHYLQAVTKRELTVFYQNTLLHKQVNMISIISQNM